MKKLASSLILFVVFSISFVVSAQTMPDHVIRAAQEIHAIYGTGSLDINNTGWDWRWGKIGDNFPLNTGCNLPLNLPPSTNAKEYYRVFFDPNFDGVDEWAVVVYSDFSYFGLCTAPAYRCGSLETRLAIDATGHVDASGMTSNLRAKPGESGSIVGEIPPSAEFSVLDGPRCADDVSYWLVNYGGAQGWTAEGKEDDYWLVPGVFAEGGVELNPAIGTATPIPTSVPLLTCGGVISRLSIGIKAQVATGVTNTLYAFPGESGDYLDDIPPGRPFDIIGGPQCLLDMLWWHVNYRGTIGWTVEAGSPDEYWLEPLVFEIEPIMSASVNELIKFATITLEAMGTPTATYINDRNEIVLIWSNREVVWSPIDISAPIPNMQWRITTDRQLVNPPLATRLDVGGEVVKLTRNPANNQLINWERGTFFDEFDLSLPNTTIDIAAFHPDDGDMIMVSQRGAGFILVNSDSESPTYRQVSQAGRVLPLDDIYTQLEFSANGRTMVGLTNTSNLMIWQGITADPETWSAAFPMQFADSVTLRDVALSPDGTNLVVIGSQTDPNSGQSQGFFTLYQLASESKSELRTVYFGAGIAMTAAEFSPDGTMFAVATNAGQLIFFDATTGSELRFIGGVTGQMTDITFNQDSTMMATTASSGMVTLWRIN